MRLKKKTRTKNNCYQLDKWKELRVMLHDVALDQNLIPIYQRHLLRKKEKQSSSCDDRSRSSHNSVRLLPEKIKEEHSTISRSLITRNNWINASQGKIRERFKRVKSQCIKNNIEADTIVLDDSEHDKIIQPIFATRTLQLETDNNAEHISTKNILSHHASNKIENNTTQEIIQFNVTTEENKSSLISFAPALTCNNQMSKPVVLKNRKKHCYSRKSTIKRKCRLDIRNDVLYSNRLDITDGINIESNKVGSIDRNLLDKKNLTFIDSNSKMQEISTESITWTEYSHLDLVDSTKGACLKITQNLHKKHGKRKVMTADIIKTNLENKNSINTSKKKISKHINRNIKFEEQCFSEDSLITYNNEMVEISQEQNTETNLSNQTKSIIMDITKQTSEFEAYMANDLRKELLPNLAKELYEENSEIIRRNPPKIIAENILPKGSIKIIHNNRQNVDLGNNVVSHISLMENDHNNSYNKRKTSHIDDREIKFVTDTQKDKDNNKSPTINTVTTISNILDDTLTSENNVNWETVNIPDNKFHNKVNEPGKFANKYSLIALDNFIDNNTDSNDMNIEVTMKCERNVLDPEAQSSKFDNNDDTQTLKNINKSSVQNGIVQKNARMGEENLLEKFEKNTQTISNENILGTNTKEQIIIKERKRIAEDINKEFNTEIKKIKLNRNSWVQNNLTSIKSKNRQCKHFNDFSNVNPIVVLESNITPVNKEHSCETDTDLREHLIRRRLKKSYKLESTAENNKNSNNDDNDDENNDQNNNNLDITLSDKINVCSSNSNDITTVTNMQENEICSEKFSIGKEQSVNGTLCKKESNYHTDPIYNNYLHSPSNLQNVAEVQYTNQISLDTNKDNLQRKFTNNTTESDEDDDDCISLFAEDFLDVGQCENMLKDEEERSLHSSSPYIMSASSFDKYVKQNTTEFNEQYAKCIENGIENIKPTKPENIENVLNKQESNTGCVSTGVLKLIPFMGDILENRLHEKCKKIFYGYCFATMRYRVCYRQACPYNHNLQELVNAVYPENPCQILEIINYALLQNYNLFCDKIYVVSLKKFDIDEILTIYRRFCNTHNMNKQIIDKTVNELVSRQMSLKLIVNHLVTHFVPNRNSELQDILEFIEIHIKPGEYWDTVKSLILKLQPSKNIIEKILRECIRSEKLLDLKDVNNTLISKLHPTVILSLDGHLMSCFNNLLDAKDATDSNPTTLTRDFGERLITVETIASPDSRQSISLSQTESPKRNVVNAADKNEPSKVKKYIMQPITLVDDKPYIIQPIDDLPDARSSYRDRFWKFYADLDRFKKGLEHQDYDYVIDILESHIGKLDENSLFVRSCCHILQTEIKRSEYHLTNIIRRTVHTGTSNILGKIVFDIGLDVLASLMDKEAWGFALHLIQLLNMYDLPCSAAFIMLSAEIYLANKKTMKAFDLLKYKNMIYTNRSKWYVNSTVNDEYVRNKIMYILLDSFCKEFIEYAFFLFQFLLKDQPSLYYPIDLSRYVDKLIIIFLINKDMNLIAEMGNLIIKYNFALNTTTCRALTSTLIHVDKILAKQIYNYAEAIGIYSPVELWPVTHIIINTDLTEEEVYLTLLQLLQKLKINIGHAIEFIKPRQILVYLILETKPSNEHIYCAESERQNNNQAVQNIKASVRCVLKRRFDPPMFLMRNQQGRICRLQSKSLLNYMQSEHCNLS